jgi:hypothetical protein
MFDDTNSHVCSRKPTGKQQHNSWLMKIRENVGKNDIFDD